MRERRKAGRDEWVRAIRSGSMAVVGASIVLALVACVRQPDNGQATAKEIQQLQQRVQRLEDIQAIERLTRAYGYFVDKNLWSEVVPLFADDATVELDERGVFVGKAGIKRMFLDDFGGGKSGLKYGTLFNHIQAEGIVDVDPDRKHAEGRWHAIIQVAGFHGTDGFWSDGVYENQ